MKNSGADVKGGVLGSWEGLYAHIKYISLNFVATFSIAWAFPVFELLCLLWGESVML